MILKQTEFIKLDSKGKKRKWVQYKCLVCANTVLKRKENKNPNCQFCRRIKTLETDLKIIEKELLILKQHMV